MTSREFFSLLGFIMVIPFHGCFGSKNFCKLDENAATRKEKNEAPDQNIEDND
jgi:hypothetical protein